MWLGVMWAAAAGVMGFALGRASMYEKAEDTGQEEEGSRGSRKAGRKESKKIPGRITGKEPGKGAEKVSRQKAAGRKSAVNRGTRRGNTEKKGSETGLKFWSVGSPVSGEVSAYREGERPVVVIRPDSDRLYAPVSGKVTRLFPMGNSFLFATEFGAELYIQAGECGDELLGRYYRPKVVQNEIVGKGKLLLEFDRQGIETEGASAEVCVSVENCFYGGNVRIAAEGERVKAGEEILWVTE